MNKMLDIIKRYPAALGKHAERRKLRFYVLHPWITFILVAIFLGIPYAVLEYKAAGNIFSYEYALSVLLSLMAILITSAEAGFDIYMRRTYGKNSSINELILFFERIIMFVMPLLAIANTLSYIALLISAVIG